jgi:sugar transferase (PEP-CTERM/EpsH1 system associated)
MSERPNLLMLVHRVPYPPNRGDRIRSFHLLKHLAERATVYLATLADEPLERETPTALRRYCREFAIEPLGPSRWVNAVASLATGRSATEGLFRSGPLRQIINGWTKAVPFDAVVAFCSSMTQYLDLPALANSKTIVDLVDVDSQKFLDYANARSSWKSWLYRLEGQRLRTLEKSIARRANAVTLVSQAEAEIYRSFCPNDKTLAVPNGVDLDYFQPQSEPPANNRCIFVGALDYPPNIDAMQWFCQDVWPGVRTALPDATLAIVGRNPNSALRQLGNIPGVEVVGSVPDVRPHMAAASVAIAPLRIARGIQNKVLEALAMGMPTIVSPAALEGLALEPGRHVLQAQSADQWVSAISRICGDRAAAAKLGAAGRCFVESAHSWTACLRLLDDVLFDAPKSTHSQSTHSHVLATSAV